MDIFYKCSHVAYRKSSTRRDRAASIFWGGAAPLTSARLCWGCFYESVVASAILFAVVCWGSRLRGAKANRLNELIRKASDVAGVELDSLTASSCLTQQSKVQVILQYGSHPLHIALVKRRSAFSQRLIAPECTTERHRKSFLPVAIKLYNSSLWLSDLNGYLWK